MKSRTVIVVVVLVLVLLLLSKKPASAATVPSITGAGGSASNPLSGIIKALQGLKIGGGSSGGSSGSSGGSGDGGSDYITGDYAADPSNYAPGGIAYQEPSVVTTPGTDPGLPVLPLDTADLSGFDPSTGLPFGYDSTATPAGSSYVDPFNDPSNTADPFGDY